MSRISIAILIATFTFGLTGCATYTRFERWITLRGEFNDARYLPFAVVANDETRKAELQKTSDQQFEKVLKVFRIEDQSLVNYLFEHNTNSMVILHRGQVVFEQYANGVQRHSIQPTYSVTKSILSLLVEIAIEDGEIDSIDSLLSQYIPNLGSNFDGVTIQHCLNMVSGLALNKVDFAGIPLPWSDDVKEYYDPNLRRLVKHMSFAEKPDTEFSYQNYNQILIALVLEAATRKDLATYASEKLWKPLGMEYSAHWSIDSYKHRFAKPAAGFNATAIDLARLGDAVLSRSDVIPDSAANRAIAPCCVQPDWSLSADEAIHEPELAHIASSVRYSSGWWGVQAKERYDFYANGHRGQFIYLSPAAELVIVRLGSDHGGADDLEFGFHFFRFATEIVDVYETVRRETLTR